MDVRLQGDVQWMPGGDMSSPSGEIVTEAFGAYRERPDEVLGHMQIAKFEPQELMRFLEFCLGKIREEVGSRISEPTSKRVQ
jgi:hypothetical protein